MFNIIFYCSVSGENYVMDFLKSLPENVQIKAGAYIKYLATFAHLARRPYVGILRDKIMNEYKKAR